MYCLKSEYIMFDQMTGQAITFIEKQMQETDPPVLECPSALLDVLLLPIGDAPLLEQLVELLGLHQHELLVVDLQLLDEPAHLTDVVGNVLQWRT